MKKMLLALAVVMSVFVCSAKEYSSASDWPCEVKTEGTTFQIFEPSVELFSGNNLKLRSAVAIQKAATTNEPIYGAIWITALSSNDTVNRKVVCDSMRVAKFKCPDAEDMEISYAADLQNALKTVEMTLDLDYVLRLEKEEAAQTRNEAELLNDPPKILCVTNATVLVEIDGAPIMRKLDDAGKYEAVANTPFCLVFDTTKNCYYLKGANYWLTAPNLQSDFFLIAKVPDEVKSYGESLELTDEEKESFKDSVSTIVPKVIVVTEPTELIAIDGVPRYKNVEGTDIMYAENTDNDLFYCAADSRLYVLLSGRWYVHNQSDDSWEFVAPDKLPSGFYKMNAQNGKESVLPHIKGTPEAKEAVADTYVPQTVKVARKAEEVPEVVYDGTPQFKEIPEAYPVAYAVNTPHDIIRVNDRYYLCENAIWYESVDPVTGWQVCINVPSVIYSIPPAYPVYHVRYVRVYNYTPDYVYVGYYPGYVGCFVDRGVVVYGTGYRYAPWVGTYYYPWPATFGFGVSYSLGFGWGFNISWGAPIGWVGFGFCWSNYHWGWRHHHRWHGGHCHWWGRGCGPWDHHHVYRRHGHGCGDRYHHGKHCPGGKPGPGQPPRKAPAGRYLVDEPVKSANRPGVSAGTRNSRQSIGNPLQTGLRADKNGNIYTGSSRSSRVGTPASGSTRVGTPSSGSTRVGTPSSGSTRVGTPSSGSTRVGTPSSGSTRVGTPSSGSTRVGTPSSGSTRVGTSSGSTRVGTTVGGSTTTRTGSSGATRVGTPVSGGSSTVRTGSSSGSTIPVAGRVDTSSSSGSSTTRTATPVNQTRRVNNPSVIRNTGSGRSGSGSTIRSGNSGGRSGSGAGRQGARTSSFSAPSGFSGSSAVRTGSSLGSASRMSSGMGGGSRMSSGMGGGARMSSGMGSGARMGGGGGARMGGGMGGARMGGGGRGGRR